MQTVTGEISSNAYGRILMHEHIRSASNDMLHTFGDTWLDRERLVDHSAQILISLKERYHVGILVDGTPIDQGRDVTLLKEISQRSGVKIIASTGLYNYPSMITAYKDEQEIASWFLREIEIGMEGTGIKPGILKCACDHYGITQENAKRLSALGTVQAQTGLPMYVHCSHQKEDASKALKIFEGKHVDLKKLIIGHAVLRADFHYLKSFLDQGCYVCMDQGYCTTKELEKSARNLVALCEKGYTNKILLSNDAWIYSDFAPENKSWLKKENISNTFGYIFESLYPKFLQFGGEQNAWDRMTQENPWEILTSKNEGLFYE